MLAEIEAIKKYLQQSVLCWLATSSPDYIPNVSPKEIFTLYQDKYLLIANIASPQTVRNLEQNPNVCVSFIDVFVQKGYQLKGTATVIPTSNPEFQLLEPFLLELTKGLFPFQSIIKIKINTSKKILAPRYLLYPDTTEAEQIKRAQDTYNKGLPPFTKG
ncbi:MULTISPECIES: pyridoxamine 5'-phosphate oxidase family protein [unclassified Aureispira]|uniref:pyridoxamine 5'-phosphate oxidase family protein n=1 Tax=unclassified Aureispira TaxID=2649989 RepID=UPI000695A62D|nr:MULTISPECIES: pyridoxamine 5'-phosphate oxidase family protein [unclassified Aureispira]WMX14088.1 pyridoxamine 5'-phosphate oxidase family protein [Aureispira sp. CCB-E]